MLKDSESYQVQRDKADMPNETTEFNCTNDEKCILDKHIKNKQRKNRELEVLAESQIINARLRSDSGKVYSSGLVVESPSQNTSLSTVLKEENSGEIEIYRKRNVSQGGLLQEYFQNYRHDN